MATLPRAYAFLEVTSAPSIRWVGQATHACCSQGPKTQPWNCGLCPSRSSCLTYPGTPMRYTPLTGPQSEEKKQSAAAKIGWSKSGDTDTNNTTYNIYLFLKRYFVFFSFSIFDESEFFFFTNLTWSICVCSKNFNQKSNYELSEDFLSSFIHLKWRVDHMLEVADFVIHLDEREKDIFLRMRTFSFHSG